MLLTLRMFLAVTGLPTHSPEGSWSRTRVDCVSRCFYSSSCSSLFYDKTTKMCYMLNTVHDKLELEGFAAPQDKTYLIWQRDKCTEGYTWIRALNLCYKINVEAKNWEDAGEVCKQDGGQLLKVESAEVNSFFNRIATNIGQSLFLGGTDREEEGTWIWSDASPVLSIFWAPGQPNNIKNNQHCLLLGSNEDHSSMKWHDVKCYEEYGFVCQISLLD